MMYFDWKMKMHNWRHASG